MTALLRPALLAAGSAAVLLTAACGTDTQNNEVSVPTATDQTTANTPPPGLVPSPSGTTIAPGAIAAPALRDGEPVDLTGIVGSQAFPTGFLLVGTPLGGTGLLVLAKQAPTVAQGDPVRVQGTARTFNADRLGGELGLDLTDQRYERFDGATVIVADSVSVVPSVTAGATSSATS